MFATMLSRRKTHPMLLVQSSLDVPRWISPLESHKLAVGESDFTCCEKNHEGIFQKCDREKTCSVLNRMIQKKVEHLFQSSSTVLARLFFVQQFWYLRGHENSGMMQIQDLDEFRTVLQWSDLDDSEWFDRGGVSILFYAVMYNCLDLVLMTLAALDSSNVSETERCRRLMSRIPHDGIVRSVLSFFTYVEHSLVSLTQLTQSTTLTPYQSLISHTFTNIKCDSIIAKYSTHTSSSKTGTSRYNG